jgi:hypothetical protein
MVGVRPSKHYVKTIFEGFQNILDTYTILHSEVSNASPVRCPTTTPNFVEINTTIYEEQTDGHKLFAIR